ncbi:hypothetical protein RND81_06G026100 [Saponaria officinalis]|uniref:Phosphatidylinositol N-acetylglucosaminyltransferase subunit H conserved domain-containing protein n=1 Tax=Saponaria officinalis TaxID=3572 RepID=A0AAW1K6L5_SAPOF
MTEKRIANSRYTYMHETGKWPAQTVDIHHVAARKGDLWRRAVFFSAIAISLIAYCVLLGEDISASILLLHSGVGAFFIKLLRRKLVERESVVIIPAFGVQLETHFRSGRAVRRFVPIDNILKPVLNECVTPVTCYWSLALILRDEEELTLVFKASRPPLTMLLPIWKALCAAAETGEKSSSTM